MTPGQLLLSVRMKNHLTQAQVAERAGTKQSSVSRVETDTISPTCSTLDKLITAAGGKLVLADGKAK